MGAIADASSLPILKEFLKDSHSEVVQTCELAIEKVEFENNPQLPRPKGNPIYTSEDPAPPDFEDSPVDELRAILLDTKLPLFKRYRAMFALRNQNTPEAVLVRKSFNMNYYLHITLNSLSHKFT